MFATTAISPKSTAISPKLLRGPTASRVVHLDRQDDQAGGRTAPGGEVVPVDLRLGIPFVASGSYTGTMTFRVTANP